MAVQFIAANERRLSLAYPILAAYPVTVMGWYRIPAASEVNGRGLNISQSGSGTRIICGVQWAPTPVWEAAAINGGSGQPAATTPAPTDEWTHVACVWASETSRSVYVNGANKASNANSISFGTCNVTDVGAVRLNDVTAYGTQDIDRLAVWNAVPTDQQVADVYAGGADGANLILTDNRIAYWPLVEDYLNVWQDDHHLVANGSGGLSFVDGPQFTNPRRRTAFFALVGQQ